NAFDTLNLSASASDADGTVILVEYYVDGRLVTSASSAPYTATWGPLAAGSHQVYARAYDDSGNQAPSCAAVISVASTVPAPWLKISRAGNAYSTYTSSDGAVWTQFPATAQTVALGAVPDMGLVAGHSTSLVPSQFQFDNFSQVISCFTPTATPTVTRTVTLT